MNATVTRSATKAAKNVSKPATKSVATPKVTTAKQPGKTATQPAVSKATSKTVPKSAAQSLKAKEAGTKTVKQPPPSEAKKANAEAQHSGSRVRDNNANAGLTDKIDSTVVSRVREVATKTTKSTPAVPENGALLTEAQILAMSDKDYMNQAQLAFFKARLQQLEKDLLKNAGETTEHLRETVLVPDPADRATIEEEHALELRTRDRERKLLKKVQQSIISIDAGEYGWCEETGEPIGIPRLLARPTATLSLEAQQRRELKQKLYGD